ncbi:HAUS augmin-like complex subunit 8 [Galemys pyrenaicus]|uniref:HAUS augmin-like complex subunit 8 n=1 Tax=Galemys pyrenaicus TaxID=202257 RepID=A0A8J6DSZ7_GALPY|nr:HAUS augmin-like complex subunit 8 [Galemys pyrenaicus]
MYGPARPGPGGRAGIGLLESAFELKAGKWRIPWVVAPDGSGIGKGDLQSTLLEGHGTAPPDLDLSAINDKSVLRKVPQLEKTMSKKTESSSSFSASRRKSPFLLHAKQMENSLAPFEEKAERSLLTMCKEKEQLQKKVHELKRRLLLCQRMQELVDILDAQIEMLSPYEALAQSFKEQYKMLATALDSTRHELPVNSIYLDGDGSRFLDDLQQELMTTRHLLGELGLGSSEENGKVLELLNELKEATQAGVEGPFLPYFHRSFAQVLELSAEASKEAALSSQEAWEEAQGPAAARQWYFSPEGACGDSPSDSKSPLLSWDSDQACVP